MLGELLERTTRGARLAALIAVALVAGFGVATAVGAPGPTRLVTVVAGDQGTRPERHCRRHRERQAREDREAREDGEAGEDGQA